MVEISATFDTIKSFEIYTPQQYYFNEQIFEKL